MPTFVNPPPTPPSFSHLPPPHRSVLSAVKTACPQLAPEALTADFPVWRDVLPMPHTADTFGAAALAEFHSKPQEIP